MSTQPSDRGEWLHGLTARLEEVYNCVGAEISRLDDNAHDLEQEIAVLRQRLADCEGTNGNGGDEDHPDPSPHRTFHPDRNRFLWLTQLGEEEVNQRWNSGKGDGLQGVVVRLDLANRDYGQRLLAEMRQVEGLLIGAYVRAPVHAAYPAPGQTLPPYEEEIAILVERVGATLKRADGSVIWRTANDVDLNIVNRSEATLREHAQITATHLGHFGFDFALLDGLTSHIYTADPWRADWDGDGIPDYSLASATGIGRNERGNLKIWLQHLKDALPGHLDLIGNGSGEPSRAELNERWGPNGEPMRWEFAGFPTVIQPSFWFDKLDGFMQENLSWPSYKGYRFDAQYPRISETIHMWATEAIRWRAADKWVLLGGRFEQMGPEPEAADRLLQGLSLILDAGYVAPRRALPARTLGEAVGPATNQAGQSLYTYQQNVGAVTWERLFDHGAVAVDPRRGHEDATYG